MSSDDWESEDDEQLSQSLSQSLSQQPAGLVVPKQESDDSWASEDDEQLSQELLSQELLSQQGSEPRGSQLASWVSPRIKLEAAMDAARLSVTSMASPTLDSIGTALDDYDNDVGGGSSSSDSITSDSDGGDPDVHPLLRRCARNELRLRLGVPAWRRAEAGVPEPIEDAHANVRGDDSDTCAVIGQNWTQRERHAFFRALRRCGKHPHNISKRVGTKSPIEVAVYLRQLHAASVACGAIGEGEGEREDAGEGADLSGSSTEDEAEAEDAGDCRYTLRGFLPTRPAGGFPGKRCPHWPACEGDQSLPSNTVWEQRGWSGLELHEQQALRLLGLNNLARYLAQKTGYHSFASYDSGAALELHAQLVTLLASIVSAATIQAVQRSRSHGNHSTTSTADTKATVLVTLSDIAIAAAGVAPHQYSEKLLHQWASQHLPVNPFGNRAYRPVTERSAVWTQARPISVSIGNQKIVGPICSLPSMPPNADTMIELETKMREGTLRRAAFTEQEIQVLAHGFCFCVCPPCLISPLRLSYGLSAFHLVRPRTGPGSSYLLDVVCDIEIYVLVSCAIL